MTAASYWASWAGALEMISERLPAVTTRVTDQWTGEGSSEVVWVKFQVVTRQLDWSDFVSRPTLKLGAGPPTAWFAEPDERQHD